MEHFEIRNTICAIITYIYIYIYKYMYKYMYTVFYSAGQYASLGPVAVYEQFCPLFRGLGYGMVLVSSIVMLYYNLIIAWTLYYIFASVNGK